MKLTASILSAFHSDPTTVSPLPFCSTSTIPQLHSLREGEVPLTSIYTSGSLESNYARSVQQHM